MSNHLVWKKEYEIGVTEIDIEHQLFLKIIQKLDEAFMDESGNEYIERLLHELYNYAQFHFTSEENVMFKEGYPDLANHHLEHNALIKRLGDLMVTYDPQFLNREKLIDFLFEWFKLHTSSTDVKLAKFLNG